LHPGVWIAGAVAAIAIISDADQQTVLPCLQILLLHHHLLLHLLHLLLLQLLLLLLAPLLRLTAATILRLL
jgi:hypothetical protein